jgi:competence protein ComEC
VGRWWLLPACAASFWLGTILGGKSGAGWAGVLAIGWLAIAARWGRTSRRVSEEVLRVAGLVDDRPPADPRRAILKAGGLWPREAAPANARWPGGRILALTIGVALGGFWWVDVRTPDRPPLADLDGRFVAFRGLAASDAQRSPYGWSAEVGIRELRFDGRARRTDSRVWVQGSERPPSLEAGMPVAGSGTLGTVGGTDGFEEYLRARGIVATIDADEVAILGPPPNPFLRLANAARRGLRHGADHALPPREAGLLLGLTIGDTSRMDPEVEEDFRATGLGHLVAVSGSNVAMFLAPVLVLVASLRLARGGRVAVGVVAVAFFVLLTRWEPSVLRAGAMAGLALAGTWAGRPRSTAGLLGAAVLTLLILDPGLGRSVGFQLSVAATLGLAALAGPLAGRLGWLPRPVALAVAATLAAQLAVTPLLLWLFGAVPTVTVLANVLAFPAVPVALFGGVAAAGVGLMAPPLGAAIGPLARLPLSYLVGVADRMARFGLPAVTSSAGWVPVAAAGVVMLVGWRVRQGRRPAGAVAGLLVVALVAWTAAPQAGPPRTLTVVFLDVGQGDAAVVRTPEGGTVVIDAGPEPDDVAIDLARLGVRRIDLAVATHAHADHVEGFPAVLARFAVSLMIEPGCPGDSPSYRRLLEAVAAEDVPVRHPRGGARLSVGRLAVEVLGPDRCSSDSPNADSLVLRLSYGGDSVLFPGDAEVPAQEDLLADGDPVAADVLKVPHHGGDTSTPEFFERTGADVAVVSTGPNEYGHPVASVLAELRRAGMQVLRTDHAGDVTVRFEGQGLLVESERT